MDAGFQFFRQSFIYHAVTRNTGFAFESIRYNCDAEMALTQRMTSRMARMLIAFVNDIKYDRLESRDELALKRLANRAQFHHLLRIWLMRAVTLA
jgi:hypothetical protein